MVENAPGESQKTPRLDTMTLPNGRFMLIVSNAADLKADEITDALHGIADKVGAAAVLVTEGPVAVGGPA